MSYNYAYYVIMQDNNQFRGIWKITTATVNVTKT